MAQWVTGQLNNVYNMKDPLTAKHTLLQVILAVKDATSLPWGQLGAPGPPQCMTWRRATSTGEMPLNGPSTASSLHRCQWPILNSHSNITPRKFVSFIMMELAHMKITTGPTCTSAVIVIGWGGYSSTQRPSATVRINPKIDRQ